MLFSKSVVAAGIFPAALVLGWGIPGVTISLSLGIPGIGQPGHPWATTSCPGGTTTTTQTKEGTTTITPSLVESTTVTTVTETAAPTTSVTTSTSTATDSTNFTSTVTAPAITASLTTTLTCFSSPGVQQGPVLLPSTNGQAAGKREAATAQHWPPPPPPRTHSPSSLCSGHGATTVTKTVTTTVTEKAECSSKTTSPGKHTTKSEYTSKTKHMMTSTVTRGKHTSTSAATWGKHTSTSTTTWGKPKTTSSTTWGKPKTTSTATWGKPKTTSSTTWGKPKTTSTATWGKPKTTSTTTWGKPKTTSCKTETVTQTWYNTVTAPQATTTSTSTSTVTSTPTETSTSITTTTVSVGSTSTTTVTSTVSVVAFAEVQPTGFPYYDYYPRTYGTSDNLWSNLSNVVNGLSNNRDYQNTGLIKNVNTLSSARNRNLTLPDGTSVPGSGFSLLFQAYLWPIFGPGSYSVVSRRYYNDDTALMWVGDKALGNNWHYENVDYQQMYPGSAGAINTGDGVATFTLGANQVMPLTFLFGNVAGAGAADFVLRFQGTDYTDTSSYLVADCEGSNNFTP